MLISLCVNLPPIGPGHCRPRLHAGREAPHLAVGSSTINSD